MKHNLSFNEEVKYEICNLSYDKESSYYILLSLFMNTIHIKIKNKQQSYVIYTQYPQLVRLIKNLLSNINHEFNTNISVNELEKINQRKMLQLEIIDNNDEFDKYFNLWNFDEETLDNDLKKRSFILGAYLSHGSISFSNTKSSYHFEIKSHKFPYLRTVQKLLNYFSIETKVIAVKNTHVLYFKKAEYISDTLKLFNVVDCLYKFEDFRIQKDFSNSLQRLNNLEISNIKRTIGASQQQQEWIANIKKSNFYNELSKKEKLFCEIRLKEPEASLATISKILEDQHNMVISRTTLNHYVRKIKTLNEKLKD